MGAKKESKDRKVVHGHARWFVFILVLTFCLALAFGFATEYMHSKSIPICIVLLLLLTAVAFVCDVFAMASSYGDVSHFNAMASRKISGASTAIRLMMQREKVQSILSDIVGDVCAIVSGAVGVALATVIVGETSFKPWENALIFATINAGIAAFVICMKFLAKVIAQRNSTKVCLILGRIVMKLSFKKENGKRRRK